MLFSGNVADMKFKGGLRGHSLRYSIHRSSYRWVQNTQLLNAARRGDIYGVLAALRRGANPNVKGRMEETALHAALGSPNAYAVVKCLLQEGANPRQTDYLEGQTTPQAALRLRNWRALNLLGRLGMLEGENILGEPFIAVAVKLGVEHIHKAIEFGGDVFKRDCGGRTALHKACCYTPCTPRISAVLEHVPLSRIVDLVNSVDYMGRTPLHYVVEIGDTEAVSALIGYYANVNASDCYGLTPLAEMVERARDVQWDEPEEAEFLNPSVLSSPLGRVLVQHIEQLYAIGCPIANVNLQYLTGTLEDIENKYTDEIKGLYMYKVGGSSFTPIELFFCTDLHFLRAMTNHNIVNAIQGENFRFICKGYAQYILNRFKLMRVHFKKFKSIVEIFHVEKGLPLLCAELIAELAYPF